MQARMSYLLGGDFGSRKNKRSGSDLGLCADDGALQDECAHLDQGAVLHSAALKHNTGAEGNKVSNLGLTLTQIAC